MADFIMLNSHIGGRRGLRPYRLHSSRQETSGWRPATCRALRKVALMTFWHCGGWSSGRRGDVGRFARAGSARTITAIVAKASGKERERGRSGRY